MGRRARSFEANLKEMIRRGINSSEQGTVRLKWCLAGIKLLQLEKMTGSAEHGTGFASLDDEAEPDETELELTESAEEEGAPDGGSTGHGNGGGSP